MTDNFRDIAYTLAEGQNHQAQTHGGTNDLFKAMAEFAGRSGWTFVFTVVFKPGARVTSHSHVEDVVLYYPDGNLEVPLIADGEKLYAEPGEMIFVKRGIKHEVPYNTMDTNRLSIAMMVTDE